MYKLSKIAAILISISTILSITACAVVSNRESMGEYVDDTTITSKVKGAILKDRTLTPFEIHVETMQGVVQLSGFVDSQATSQKAYQHAKDAKGVRDVKNNLVIK